MKTADCEAWFHRFSQKYSPQLSNNTLDLFRAVLDIACQRGAIISNPAREIKKVRLKRKKLDLPSLSQFADFVREIRNSNYPHSTDSGDLVEFMT